MTESSDPRVNRRTILKGTAAAAAGAAAIGAGNYWLGAAANPSRSCGKKVIVIGIDGMDPRLSRADDGAGAAAQPGEARATAAASATLGTSTPPQSPVAWANFINGAGPGDHGIFDFIHRHPEEQCAPFYSAAETIPGEGHWDVGDHRLPLDFWPFNHKPARTVLKRQGVPFWDYLDEAGVPSTFYDLPSNYPASPSHHGHHRCLCGMGTPGHARDLRHLPVFRRGRTGRAGRGAGRPVGRGWRSRTRRRGPGSSGPDDGLPEDAPRDVGRVPRPPRPRRQRGRDRDPGPADRPQGRRSGAAGRRSSSSSQRQVPADAGPARDLPLLPAGGRARTSGCTSRRSTSTRPRRRRRSPSPTAFVRGIAARLGPFATTGFQEDYKARTNGIFDDDEYARQAGMVLEERLALLEHAVDNYEDGLLFFYFSSSDLQSHMFWWDSDERHPIRSGRRGEEILRARARAVPQARPGRRRADRPVTAGGPR